MLKGNVINLRIVYFFYFEYIIFRILICIPFWKWTLSSKLYIIWVINRSLTFSSDEQRVEYLLDGVTEAYSYNMNNRLKKGKHKKKNKTKLNEDDDGACGADAVPEAESEKVRINGSTRLYTFFILIHLKYPSASKT